MKKIICRYRLRPYWAKFYTIFGELADLTNKPLNSNSLERYPELEFYISEYGYLNAINLKTNRPRLMTDFSGDITFHSTKDSSYYNFIAKIKNGRMLGIFHFPTSNTRQVNLNETSIDSLSKCDNNDCVVKGYN